MKLATLLLALLALTLPAARAGDPVQGGTPVVVEAPAGSLEGVRQGGVQRFLGVPFAQAPVGERRWREPSPMPRWKDVRKAHSFGASCYQEWPAKPFGPFTAEYVETPAPSEDCLFLNIWTPAESVGKLPVLVWIHGGGFGGGSGAIEIYDGAHLAARGLVVIAINYRVGPFGFLAHPELTREAGASGNYGLEDMVAALRWIEANVAAFGGDKRRVTIAGQSAGAVAVDDLLSMPPARGLFSAAIAQSGSGLGIATLPLGEAEDNGVKFAGLVGAKSLAELRALPPEKIQAGIPSFFAPGGMSQPRIPFRPVLDGAWLRVDPVDGAAPAEASVPVLTGFTADEFTAPGPRSPADFEAGVRRHFGAGAQRFLALYPHATEQEATASERLLARDTFLASLWIWSQRRLAQGQGAVFAYLFEHPSPGPVAATEGAAWGSFHTSDVPYVFGNLDPKRRSYGDADVRVSEHLQARWAAFISAHDPNVAGLPQWPATRIGDRHVMRLGDGEGPVAPVSTAERMAAFEEFVAAGGRLSAM